MTTPRESPGDTPDDTARGDVPETHADPQTRLDTDPVNAEDPSAGTGTGPATDA